MIDVALFVLTGSPRTSVLAAITTIAWWWFLSDYYMARGFSWWTETMDLLAFIPAAVLLLLGILVFCRWRISHGLASPEQLVALMPDDRGIEVAAWQRLLEDLQRDARTSTAARYISWLRERLSALPSGRMVRARDLRRCWWRTLKTMRRVWPVSAWFPALCVALVLIPRYTDITNRLAVVIHGSDTRIFDVVISGLAPARPGTDPEYIGESIKPDQTKTLSRVHSALVSNGSITLHVTDFPRVYRRVTAICSGSSPSCRIALSSEPVVRLDAEAPVRAGLARLDFIQTTPEPRLDLKLWLQRWDGGVVDEVTIEPKPNEGAKR